jgi:hypothetical protein
MGQSSNEGEPTNGVALKFFREQFDKRPDEEGLKANAREAFLVTFKRFGTGTELEAMRLGDAFLETAEASRPQRIQFRDGLDEAWAIYRAAPTKTGTTQGSGANRNGRKQKAPRLTWRYAPVPLAIVDDRNMSGVAVKVAAIIARSINLGKWNQDLYAKLTYAELADKAGVSRATAARALDHLKSAGYIRVESLTRGGCRITFQQAHQ